MGRLDQILTHGNGIDQTGTLPPETLEDFKNSVDTILENKGFCFEDFINFVDENFDFQPCAFFIGDYPNKTGQNKGSLKVLTYALMMGYDKEQTLELFGEHYTDVKNNPEGDNHQNIRALMEHSIESVRILGRPLRGKTAK